ncbi:MAG: hypothetical protein QXR93_06375 [Archaeoglobaceae archaeon]
MEIKKKARRYVRENIHEAKTIIARNLVQIVVPIVHYIPYTTFASIEEYSTRSESETFVLYSQTYEQNTERTAYLVSCEEPVSGEIPQVFLCFLPTFERAIPSLLNAYKITAMSVEEVVNEYGTVEEYLTLAEIFEQCQEPGRAELRVWYTKLLEHVVGSLTSNYRAYTPCKVEVYVHAQRPKTVVLAPLDEKTFSTSGIPAKWLMITLERTFSSTSENRSKFDCMSPILAITEITSGISFKCFAWTYEKNDVWYSAENIMLFYISSTENIQMQIARTPLIQFTSTFERAIEGADRIGSKFLSQTIEVVLDPYGMRIQALYRTTTREDVRGG